MTSLEPILHVENLSVAYGNAPTVSDISFAIKPGECLAIVGESGSGKTTLAKTILGLLPRSARVTAGRVTWNGDSANPAGDLVRDQRLLRRLLGNELAYIPQSPLLSFDPLMAIGRQAVEPLEIHGRLKRPWQEAAAGLLEAVAIDHPEVRVHQHSFELSGGMLQRVLLTSALSTNPRLVIADEPTASLDTISQAAVLELIDGQIARHGAALLLITHDLGMALDRADSILVMRDGKAVEGGSTAAIASAPRDEYARRLLSHVRRATGHDSGLVTAATRPASTEGVNALPTLDVRGLTKSFAVPGKAAPGPASIGSPTLVEAESRHRPGAFGVSFVLPRGRTLVLVGESGSGKSTVANLVAGQLVPDAGEILLEGQPLGSGRSWVRDSTWRRVQLIHQDSISTFDPRYTAAQVVEEPLRNLASAGVATRQPEELLELVGLSRSLASRQARSLSGGQAQRLAIARALAVNPRLLLLDEAVSALDVLVREHILELLRRLQAELGLSYLFITHDLSVAREIADEIIVMRGGHVIERGDPDTIYWRPVERYTRQLIGAIPGQKFLASLDQSKPLQAAPA